jgi:mono/diheme cytochrome c family protein
MQNLHRIAISIVLLLALFLLGACTPSPQNTVDPTALPYTPSPLTTGILESGNGDPVQGSVVFDQHCAGCHSVEESVVLFGPSLNRAGLRFEFTYVKDSIENPHEVMETDTDAYMPKEIAEQLSLEELDDVIAYVLSLK